MSFRKQKVSRAIQRDLAPIINKIASRILPGQLVTVVEVVVTPDMGLAKVYVSFMAAEDKEKSLEVLEEHNKEIRRDLAAVIGKRARHTPSLKFYLDTTMDHAERINNLLDNLD